MSILGYSSAYFLPQYWANTPLYGEKIIPLLDYVLSTDFAHTDKLASAFYDISSKYKNTSDLPIDKIEAIIEESGYGYVRDLLGQDNESLKLLVYVLVLLHHLKGSRKGLEAVMEMLRTNSEPMESTTVGTLDVTPTLDVSGFSKTDYILYNNFNVGDGAFELTFLIRTGDNFNKEQCIASSGDYGFYLGLDTSGRVVLRVGQNSNGQRGWQTIDGVSTFKSERLLQKNSTYYIKLEYNTLEYNVKISSDDNKYTYYLTVDSQVPTDIVYGSLYIGIDKSTPETSKPFLGIISLVPFNLYTVNSKIVQWFEEYPIELPEDTFKMETELDATLANVDFFNNFSRFIERYVYPSLAALRAKLTLNSKVVFIPYVRQKVTYIASNLLSDYEKFNVVVEDNVEEHTPYEVSRGVGEHENFMTKREDTETP